MAARGRELMLLSLALTFGCTLLAPSRDEVTGGAQAGGGTGAVIAGGGTSATGGAGQGGTGASGGTGNVGGSGGATGGTGNAGGSGGATGGSGGASGAGGGTTGGTGGTGGAGGNTGGSGGWQLIYEDLFDTTTAWSQAGGGNYTVTAGELLQSNQTSGDGVRWVTALSGSDYRIETRVRLLATQDTGAYQIVWHLTVGGYPSFYFCSWHPQSGNISFGRYDSILAAALGDFYATVMPDPLLAVTLVVEVTGNSYRCRVLERPDADFTVVDSKYPAGSVGVKTYKASAAYDWFRVYGPKT